MLLSLKEYSIISYPSEVCFGFYIMMQHAFASRACSSGSSFLQAFRIFLLFFWYFLAAAMAISSFNMFGFGCGGTMRWDWRKPFSGFSFGCSAIFVLQNGICFLSHPVGVFGAFLASKSRFFCCLMFLWTMVSMSDLIGENDIFVRSWFLTVTGGSNKGEKIMTDLLNAVWSLFF